MLVIETGSRTGEVSSDEGHEPELEAEPHEPEPPEGLAMLNLEQVVTDADVLHKFLSNVHRVVPDKREGLTAMRKERSEAEAARDAAMRA